MTDKEFLSAFEAAKLPRELWTHAAHLRMTFLVMRETGSWEAAMPRIREGIIRYNLSGGNRRGYHDTVTSALVRIIAWRLQQTPAATFEDFERQNRDLFDDCLGVLDRHYSHERLFSIDARTEFLAPDREPLPEPAPTELPAGARRRHVSSTRG